MDIGTSLHVFREIEKDWPGYMGRIAAAGFTVLDFNGIDCIRPWLAQGEGAGDRLAAECAAAAAGAGLRFSQSHGPMFSSYDDQCQNYEPLMQAGFDWSARVGAPWMVMHPFTLPGMATWQENHRANVEFYRAWLPTCERLGVGLALENMSDRFGDHRRYCSTPDELVHLVEALDHPLAGICWDTGHAHLQRLDQTWAIGQLGSLLKITHIADNNGLRDDHILPSHGTVDWEKVRAGLQAAGYGGAWSLECHNGIARVPEELRDLTMKVGVEISRWLTRDLG